MYFHIIRSVLLVLSIFGYVHFSEAIKCYSCIGNKPCKGNGTVVHEGDFCAIYATNQTYPGGKSEIGYLQTFTNGTLPTPTSWSKWTYGVWYLDNNETAETYHYICKDRDFCNDVEFQKPKQVLPDLISCKTTQGGGKDGTCQGHFCETTIEGSSRYYSCGYGIDRSIPKMIDITKEGSCATFDIGATKGLNCKCTWPNCNQDIQPTSSEDLPLFECPTNVPSKSCIGHYCLKVKPLVDKLQQGCVNVTDSIDCEVGVGCASIAVMSACLCKGDCEMPTTNALGVSPASKVFNNRVGTFWRGPVGFNPLAISKLLPQAKFI